jgi:hypothetical protein
MVSVLGRREIAGPGSALLEGRFGSNHPVGVALLMALLTTDSGWGRSRPGDLGPARRRTPRS